MKRNRVPNESSRQANRKYYENNKPYFTERNRRHRVIKLDYLTELKRSPCTDCGNTYPTYVMEFDHREPEHKSRAVAAMTSFSWAKLKEEIAKCDVVCANCHKVRTYNRTIVP